MTQTSVSPEAIERIAREAEFSKKHIEGIAFNTERKVEDSDSWYIGMVRGRQLALEWALRELKGEGHEVLGDLHKDGIEEALTGVAQI